MKYTRTVALIKPIDGYSKPGDITLLNLDINNDYDYFPSLIEYQYELYILDSDGGSSHSDLCDALGEAFFEKDPEIYVPLYWIVEKVVLDSSNFVPYKKQ